MQYMSPKKRECGICFYLGTFQDKNSKKKTVSSVESSFGKKEFWEDVRQ